MKSAIAEKFSATTFWLSTTAEMKSPIAEKFSVITFWLSAIAEMKSAIAEREFGIGFGVSGEANIGFLTIIGQKANNLTPDFITI